MGLIKLANKEKHNNKAGKILSTIAALGLGGIAAYTMLRKRKMPKINKTNIKASTFKPTSPKPTSPKPTSPKPTSYVNSDDLRKYKYKKYLHEKYGKNIPFKRPKNKYDDNIGNSGFDEWKYNNKMIDKLIMPFGSKYKDKNGEILLRQHRLSTQNIPLTNFDIKQFKRKVSKRNREIDKNITYRLKQTEYDYYKKYISKKGKIIPFAPPPPTSKPASAPESKHFDLTSSNVSDIKKQFREKLKSTHPDLGGNPEEFRSIHEEYKNISGSPWFKRISKPKRKKKKAKMGLISLAMA